MQAEVRIQVDGDASLLEEALRPEMEVTERTKVEIQTDGQDLVIRIWADDVVALRAALNSYLRWTKLAIDSQEAIGAE